MEDNSKKPPDQLGLKANLKNLKSLIEHLENQLIEIEHQQKVLNSIMKTKGYTIKVIKGKPYIYVWHYMGREEGRSKYRWKCLGRADRLDIQAIREEAIKSILEDYQKLEIKKHSILEAIDRAVEIFSSLFMRFSS